ncbi:MAG: hypothetical protein AW11_03982 [Candidatus Accumulibacter regalis]|jgi:hypothetical protein|uniref:Lipoprotein n=1 Tax=Accumulibacter regalis TaxID=522306 RepID=A0A011NMU0_ACCRE|nr:MULTISPECIES: hypothetical protein [unclassified Candidatus Accumulibacter]EXI84033.1 MAG: hypothetical protein AW11_03982 [Candidatus Accumulibacter regalis]MQM35283.1 hypothetical protein [Candidatus Accumulibacter phosphatis]MBL8368159.1 hypothetical protein [Accumulibacter sp.]MBN8513440.1 hypothetical protein [Accumulibacter sp.]MBO3701713.1 hypothetical protein [Accumulibacter sp.]
MGFSLLRRTLLAALFTALLTACTSTSVISEWRDPAYRGAALKKVLVYIAASDDAVRRTVEDRLASSFPEGTQGVASYTLFPEAKEINEQNEKALSARLQKEGFDGALTARLASVDKENVYVPPQTYFAPGMLGPYGSFYGYGRYAYASLYAVPGYAYQQTRYMIETILYDVPGGKMLWTMTSESVSPDSRQQLIDEVTSLIDGELKKQGFIAG